MKLINLQRVIKYFFLLHLPNIMAIKTVHMNSHEMLPKYQPHNNNVARPFKIFLLSFNYLILIDPLFVTRNPLWTFRTKVT